MMIPSATHQLKFLQKIQLLLEEGSFSSTYKFALLLAISDLAVERGDVEGETLTLSITEIAKKFISYYWRQSSPYPAYEGEQDIIFQNKGAQADIINTLLSVQASAHTRLSQALHNEKLVQKVSKGVTKMPLWRLQNFSHGLDEFLYPHDEDKKDIVLREGVAYCLRVFHGQIQNMVKGAWVQWVSQLKRNQSVLGQHIELSDFMFGTSRADLSVYKPILKDIQANTCFFCGKALQSNSVEVDHYIPWSRYPVDLGHNFVLSHASCNNDKRDMLASIKHLDHWLNRNEQYASQLTSYFDEQKLNYDITTSLSITSWAYSKTEMMGGDVWVSKKGQTERLDNTWRERF